MNERLKSYNLRATGVPINYIGSIYPPPFIKSKGGFVMDGEVYTIGFDGYIQSFATEEELRGGYFSAPRCFGRGFTEKQR